MYVNGRELLARQLDDAGVGYLRHDNVLLRIDDMDKAVELCDRFAHRAWPRRLNAFARWANPHLRAIEAADFGTYYWVMDQAHRRSRRPSSSRGLLIVVSTRNITSVATSGAR